MFAGMTREQIACQIIGVLEALVACALLPACTTPLQTLLCGGAATLGMAGAVLAGTEG